MKRSKSSRRRLRSDTSFVLTPTGKACQKRISRERDRRDGSGDRRGLTWIIDKAQKVIDKYLARRGVLAANAYQKLEDYRDKANGITKEAAN